MVVVVCFFERNFFDPVCKDESGKTVVDGSAGVSGVILKFCDGDAGLFLDEAVDGLGTRVCVLFLCSADDKAGECSPAEEEEEQ